MDPEMETEKWRQRKTERERQRWRQRERWNQKDGEGGAKRWRQRKTVRERWRWKEREVEMQKDKEDRGRERGVVSLGPQGAPSSSLSISIFQPKGAFLTPALTLESQVLHSMSRK